MNSRLRVLAGGVLLIAMAGLVFALVWERPGESPAPPARDDSSASDARPAAPDEAPVVVDDPRPPDADAPPPVTATARRPSSGSSSAEPGAPVAGPDDDAASPAAPEPDPWVVYAGQTAAIVRNNVGELAAVSGAISAALGGLDPVALGELMAPDEGAQPAFLADLATRYPEITTTTPGGNVTVYAQGQATIYVAYAVVTWTDGGVLSTRTIPIPLRYIDGAWYLTSLFDSGGDLTLVTSVDL
jgi:hypothetical protein